jgi:CDP-6-deoxy-D-xylo-4-hexulose-3-dehydrase
MADDEDRRARLIEEARAYAEEAFAPPEFEPGETPVRVAGRVIGGDEVANLVDAALEGWLTEGRFAEQFAREFAGVAGRAQALLVGSGSQANLLAIAGACSHLHERPLKPGDEVITAALGFPTTVNPLYQQGLRPVYVDVELDTLNPSLEAIADAVTPETRAVYFAHCLGNPFDAKGVAELCAEHEMLLVEDCCDALGSTLHGQKLGTFGAAATYSFYPGHHMTTGEGGAVAVDDPTWFRALNSLREWGRDCWCPPGVNDACGHRFEGQFGELPIGYDHKYVFSHVGFNFKITDMQAAVGVAQLGRVEKFHARRRANFKRIDAVLREHEDRLVLPRALPGADPSWFGYPFTLRDGTSDQRRALQVHLAKKNIDSRLALAGNLTRQPGYLGLDHRVVGSLDGADRLTEACVWVGTYPGLTDEMVDFVAESVVEFVAAL